MNAMAMTEDNELYDPFGGRQSIQQQEIQAVGSAHDRFCEDPLRMLRAIRFMSTLNFTLSQHIIDAIKIHNEKMSNVAVERIVVELQKMYSGEGIESAKKWLVRTNLVHYLPFFKELKRSLTDSSVNNFLDELLLQIHFDHNLKTSLKTLKLSNKDQHVIKDMLKLLNDLKTGLHPKLVAFKYSRETLNRLTVISAHNHILNTSETVSLDTSIAAQPLLPIQHRQDLAIRGKAILETYATSGGPWVKEMLSVLEEAVIFEKVKNNQDDLIDWMKANVIIKDRHIKIIE
jgi:tRNA nucleotidyltransferase (CCA-adding enzyme)